MRPPSLFMRGLQLSSTRLRTRIKLQPNTYNETRPTLSRVIVMSNIRDQKWYFFFYKLPYRGSINRKIKKTHRKRSWYHDYQGHFCSEKDSLFFAKKMKVFETSKYFLIVRF